MRWNIFRTLAEILDRLADIELAHFHLNRKAEKIMAKQDDLNAIVARIDTAVAGIRSDIEDLKAQHEDVDFSALEVRVQGLEGLDAEFPVAPQEPQE